MSYNKVYNSIHIFIKCYLRIMKYPIMFMAINEISAKSCLPVVGILLRRKMCECATRIIFIAHIPSNFLSIS